MVTKVKIFVEGGGNNSELKAECRESFREFIKKAGMKGKMPRIVACGSRNSAYDKYRKEVLKGVEALLLVDSEQPVDDHCQSGAPQNWLPWVHLKKGSGDGWNKPRGESEENCHLMVECMECWVLADRKAIKSFFGKGLRESALPSDKNPPESIGKAVALAGLKKATRDCVLKGSYSKGKHSFELLAQIDTTKVIASCPWAARFFDILKQKMDR